MTFVEYGAESLRIKIPDEARASGKLKLAFRVGITLSARELVATVVADELSEVTKLNPKWVFSEGFGTIYSYVSAAESSSMLTLRQLCFPPNLEAIEVVITRWRPKKDFTLEEAIRGVYLAHEDEAIVMYEELG